MIPSYIEFYLYRKGSEKIIFNAEKTDHVLKGMTQNLQLFDKNDFILHSARETKEMKNFIYQNILVLIVIQLI